jgi:hypothetical protein
VVWSGVLFAVFRFWRVCSCSSAPYPLILQSAVAGCFERLVDGVTGRFVQNCALSRPLQEHGANVAQRPEPRAGAGVGPDVIAAESDVLPAERSDMRQETLSAHLLHGAVEVDGVPVHDRCGDQTQARGSEALVLEGAIADLALAMEKIARRRELLASPLLSPAWLR